MAAALAGTEKALAWFAVFNGVVTVATPFVIRLVAEQAMSVRGVVVFFALGIGSVVAGVYGLKARPWAFWLLFAVFLVQCAEYFSAGFFFSFMASMSLKIGWGWHSPPSRLDLNLVAIAVCVMATRAARRIAALPAAAAGPAKRAGEDAR